MRFCVISMILAFAISILMNLTIAAAPAGSAITYQGYLESGSGKVNGLADFQFVLHDSADGATTVGHTLRLDNHPVVNGVFHANLDFGYESFNGQERFLQIAVRHPAGAGEFVELSPRQPFTVSPYALALPGMRAFPTDHAYNVIGGVPANTIEPLAEGSVIAGGGGLPGGSLGGFPNIIREEYGFIGGGLQNVIGDGPGGKDSRISVVAGGQNNRAIGFGAVVGGGRNNLAFDTHSTVAGGQKNEVMAEHGTIAGGFSNLINVFAENAFIGGGRDNLIDSQFGTNGAIAGGFNNHVSGRTSFVGAGENNHADGSYSMIPGGIGNLAHSHSFAAGTRAKATANGTFVWSDDQDEDFEAQTDRTFLIRAQNGVAINTNNPLADLHINHQAVVAGREWGLRIDNAIQSTFKGGIRLSNDGFLDLTNHVDGFSGFARLNSTGNWSVASDARIKTNIEPLRDVLPRALALRPVSFNYRNEADQSPVRDGLGADAPAPHIGFIAQEVREQFPSLVNGGDPLTLNYAGLSVVAIAALREQHEEINELKVEITRRDEMLRELTNRLDELEQRLDAK